MIRMIWHAVGYSRMKDTIDLLLRSIFRTQVLRFTYLICAKLERNFVPSRKVDSKTRVPSSISMADTAGPIHVDNTMGAAYIGVIAAGILYGVSFVQTWYYFLKYRRDVWYIKTLVATVCAFETVHQALISHTVYYYVITNYNNPIRLEDMVWSILLEVLFNGLISFIVQAFLLLRVWRLSGNSIPLTVVIAALILAGFGCSTAFTAKSMKLQTWAELGQLKGLSIAVNIVGAVADILIAAALFFLLHSSRTGFKKSDTMISKLIAFTVSTGLLTSICAVASLISILASPNTLIYVAFYFCLGRLYSNSVLATLNARQIIRRMGEDSDELSFSLPAISKSGQANINATRSANISIKIDTIHEFIRDHRQTAAEGLAEPQSAVTEGSF
ncbi:unnamed protein product [Cyclocybe aegerita]|uniref:DUF6534 domain-containing protein n=1 Tax=Cyclocybe aegerita TaxID=1973307 RepID=A0A8S0WLF7_CYCAE|nr:unnamed protein product [Cyclocybe aegerita]